MHTNSHSVNRCFPNLYSADAGSELVTGVGEKLKMTTCVGSGWRCGLGLRRMGAQSCCQNQRRKHQCQESYRHRWKRQKRWEWQRARAPRHAAHPHLENGSIVRQPIWRRQVWVSEAVVFWVAEISVRSPQEICFFHYLHESYLYQSIQKNSLFDFEKGSPAQRLSKQAVVHTAMPITIYCFANF